jgi:hypothetical protein
VKALPEKTTTTAARRKFCKKCHKPLRSDNSVGYCAEHWYLSRLKGKWRKCKEPGCTNQIRSSAKTLYCSEHRYAPSRGSTEKQFCKNCGKVLGAMNHSGYCKAHEGFKNKLAPKLCKQPGCTELISARRRSGFCQAHYWQNYAATPGKREAARQRTARYRLRQQKKLAKAWRPDGWEKLSADEQMVVLMLIENPTISNREIGIRLDDSRLRCPWGDSWERQLMKPGSAANWIAKIRGIVGLPARKQK